jgi:hypothetical protein
MVWLLVLQAQQAGAAGWDNFSDSWTVTDALGRTAPDFATAGPPRSDRTVGIFYFLWLGPHAQQGGPWDISKILQKDADAMQKPGSPLWGPMHAPHHWGESIFGYYNTDDPYVLRKHAQMLSDAGVDVVIFDVTNQLTYQPNYMTLLRAWAEVRAEGNKTPQVVFLCPFWNPAKVARELYRDLYQPGIHPELWFRWRGKPLILADAEKLRGASERHEGRDHPAELKAGETLGQSFHATNTFVAAGGSFPTWSARGSGMTLRLTRDGPGGKVIASRHFENVEDNAWALLEFPAQPAGDYYLEMREGSGTVGWWSHHSDQFAKGEAFLDGKPAGGDRTLEILYEDAEAAAISNFFTFRHPQPDYFRGQTDSNMWSWLEIYPQHVFTNTLGEKEQMSVGVAQNAVNHRLGTMSEKGSLGRSYHEGKWETNPDAVNWGYNFSEQFERALSEDPRFIFITGWNEWIAGRFNEFNGVREPVMFVDEFDQEHSRDIEPMKGGHEDDYYYQMVDYIRRYKGVRRPEPASGPKSMDIQKGFDHWTDVRPEYRDDIGDTFHRDFAEYGRHGNYVNNSGRNDMIEAKVARDGRNVYFYVRTKEALTSPAETNWMWLLIDADGSPKTGWNGYDLLVHHNVSNGTAESFLERGTGGWNWSGHHRLQMRVSENEMQLAIPREYFAPMAGEKLRFNFKWADDMPNNPDLTSWLDAGDCAPNARFNYHFEE